MENVKKRRGERKMRLPDKIAPFLELLHIYRETGSENSKSISDRSNQCFVFVCNAGASAVGRDNTGI